MSERDDVTSFLLGFILGGITGAVVSLLMAPQSGEETRAIIRDKAIELKDRTTDMVDDAYTRAESAAAEARARAEELSRVARSRAEELQHRGQVVLEEQKGRLGSMVKREGKKARDLGEALGE